MAQLDSQRQPVPVDEKHTQVVEAHGVPMNEETTKDQFVNALSRRVAQKGPVRSHPLRASLRKP